MDSTDKVIQAQVDSYKKREAAAQTQSAADKEKSKLKAKIDSFNRQINAINEDNKKIKIAMSDPEYQIQILTKQMTDYIVNGGHYTDIQYLTYKRDYTTYNVQLAGYKSRLDANAVAIEKIKKQIKDTTTPPPPPKPVGSGAGGPVKPPKNPGTSPYVFNAPMVSNAYFRGIQSEILNGNYVSAGNYDDAAKSWTIDKATGKPIAGRGAFQLDRKTNTAATIAQAQKASGYTGTVDNKLYGFRFLYNPQSVNMSWGAVQKTDPVYEASGADPFVAGTSNLVQSYIDFSIIINRIEDFNYIDSKGLQKLIAVPSSNPTDYGSKIVPVKNPYPKGIDNSELIQIYEKGTMYDLEYLFRTMHGNGSYTAYKSSLMNTVTADPGWLPVRPIELHLGNKLRYRVSIAKLSINHSIFNARMVPILSTVTISCARYWDGPGNINVDKSTK